MKTSRKTRTLNGYTIIKLDSGDYKVSKDEKYLGTYTSLSAARYNILQLTSKKEA
jgi:hypothetical protein